MSNPFMGEMRWVSFNFPPKGWALSNGQLLPINQNQALFSLLGTTYGGDGRVNFALPNMQGDTGIHVGSGFTQGQAGGQITHTLITTELPAHNHLEAAASANGTQASPAACVFSNTGGPNLYGGTSNLTPVAPGTISNVGGSQPHQNMQPYLVLNCIIALVGVFPSRN